MKPFKGVIKEWALVGGRIEGICAGHTDYSGGIEKDQPISTSMVDTIFQLPGTNGAFECVTRNSTYILV